MFSLAYQINRREVLGNRNLAKNTQKKEQINGRWRRFAWTTGSIKKDQEELYGLYEKRKENKLN